MHSYEFPPLGGGGARVVNGLSRELVRFGHQVDLVTMGFKGLPRHETVGGVNVHRVPCTRLRKSVCTPPEMLSYLSRMLLTGCNGSGPYDLQHFHFIFPDGLLSLFERKHGHLPLIITAHGSDVPGYNPNRFKVLHRLMAPLWKRVTRAAEQIVCPSRSLQSLILAKNREARTTVIPNGIHEDHLRPDREKKKRIVVVSRLFERKGVQYLLEAVDGIALDHEIHVVGEGPYFSALERQALEIDAEVKFWGWLDNDSEELKELYEGSSIFVLPSASENFPIVLLEAMAASMAIVTTEGTGCAEVVGDAALLVTPRDSGSLRLALQRLAGCESTCRDLGRAARRRLEENFTWTAVARRYVELYERYALAR